MTFELWMKEVDKKLVKLCGLTHTDIADQPYSDWYNDELSPEEAVNMALDYEGFPFED